MSSDEEEQKEEEECMHACKRPSSYDPGSAQDESQQINRFEHFFIIPFYVCTKSIFIPYNNYVFLSTGQGQQKQ